MDQKDYGDAPEAAKARRSWRTGIARGWSRRCPSCGEGRLLKGLLTVRPSCDHCGLDLSGHRADDLPPYLTIVVVAHLLVPMVLVAERNFDPPMTLSIVIWCLAALGLSLLLLPRVKGAVIGLQWANEMHGFGDGEGWAERPAPGAQEPERG